MIIEHEQFAARIILREQRAHAGLDIPRLIARRHEDRDQRRVRAKRPRRPQPIKESQIGKDRPERKEQQRQHEEMKDQDGRGHAGLCRPTGPPGERMLTRRLRVRSPPNPRVAGQSQFGMEPHEMSNSAGAIRGRVVSELPVTVGMSFRKRDAGRGSGKHQGGHPRVALGGGPRNPGCQRWRKTSLSCKPCPNSQASAATAVRVFTKLGYHIANE